MTHSYTASQNDNVYAAFLSFLFASNTTQYVDSDYGENKLFYRVRPTLSIHLSFGFLLRLQF